MKKNLKYLSLLLLLFLFLFSTTIFINSSLDLDLKTLDIFNITISFAITSLITLIIYFRGFSSEPGKRAMHTFTAIGVKFILELFIALMWFVFAKKTTPFNILLFFMLYLAFSLYLIWVIVNTLKNKSL